MNKELLEKYLEDGLTHREIAQLTGKSKSTVGYWISKYELMISLNMLSPNIKTQRCSIKLILQKKLILLDMR